jgi:histidine biosynthesis protein
MAKGPRSSGAPLPSEVPGAGRTLVPCLLLRGGHPYLPGPDGPVLARSSDGQPWDPFDVVDRIAREFSLLYLIDLDGVERAEPQLDYLQEIARDIALWVDGGVRRADQAIDILVTGARRAVLSSATLDGPAELRRAWKLSSELVFELATAHRRAIARSSWATQDPLVIARSVREIGPDHIVLSPRGEGPDWELVRTIAQGGPTWVNGAFSRRDAPLLAQSGAAGGIFHIEELLGPAEGKTSLGTSIVPSTSARDDENQNQLIGDE